jgi:hypothetical protein
VLPGADFADQGLLVGDAPIEALGSEDADIRQDQASCRTGACIGVAAGESGARSGRRISRLSFDRRHRDGRQGRQEVGRRADGAVRLPQ